MVVLETDRLRLRHLASSDASFIVALLNDPDWLRYIGDRGVRDEEQALVQVGAGWQVQGSAGMELRRDGGRVRFGHGNMVAL